MKAQPLFHPKLFTTLRAYTRPLFFSDLASGVTVGIVALPLAIAFAIASGVTPDRGLITAVVAGFLISALGGSRVQIGGPTGAFVVIVYGIVAQHGMNGLLVCTLMAGAILIGMGLLRMGAILKYMPYPLIVGFTSGIAVIIFSSQVKDAFGLTTGPLPAEFIGKWEVFARQLHTLNPTATILFAASLATVHFWQRFNKRIPGSIVAIVVFTAVVHVFNLPVETIGSRFGDIPSRLPAPAFPEIRWADLRVLIGPALTVALLGGIESLLSATVADGMIESKHRSNTELIAQGVANLVSPLFGGIPATGAIARTATNVKNGGRTPVAGLVHALTLFLIMVLFGRWARLIPFCVLAAILVVVSYHMSEWRSFRSLLRGPRTDVAVLLATFFLTVFFDLTLAVQVGLVLSALLFMKRMTDVTTIREITDELQRDEESLRGMANAAVRRDIPPGVKVYEAEGALFFGVAQKLRETLDMGANPPRVIILRMRHVVALDATGLRAVQDLWRSCRQRNIHLLLSGLHRQPLDALKTSEALTRLAQENLHATFDDALERARRLVSA